MDLTTTDANGFLLERDKEGIVETAIPWDDPYPYFRIMIPSEIKNKNSEKSVHTDTPTPSEDRSGEIVSTIFWDF